MDVHICSILQMIILGTVLGHVALSAAPETASLSMVLGMFLVCEIFEQEHSVGSVHFHWDDTRVVGAWGCIRVLSSLI
jgi:hypothetical protein